MENFIVSARKYRPQTFDTVVGQDAITITLKNAIRNNQLAQAFLARSARRYGKGALRFSDEALTALARHRWPGNVRELGNLVEQCVILASDPVIEVEDLPLPVAPQTDLGELTDLQDPGSTSLPEAERRLLLSALERNRWNVTQAARALGISRDTLRYRIDKFGLRP